MNAPLSRFDTDLQTKYSAPSGWLYMTGMQALVRLPIQQRLRDAAQGLNTGGYISGYRGSPMGRYDMELWGAGKLLKDNNIVFRSGLNEDLAATAIWGAQYVGAFPGAKVDGVFGIWYGKGPGVDRSGDVLRHANSAGAAPKGGVICLAGDDHGAKSSTVVNFSDQIFIAVGMPVLYPSNAQELIDFGLHGFALSRYSGCWVGVKVVTDVVEGGGSVYVAPDWPKVTIPDAPALPGGLNIRPFDIATAQEQRLYTSKLPAALAYARQNDLNRITRDAPDARIGIVSAGKAWQDMQQAMSNLGLDEARCAELGVRVMKIGMIWPLDPDIVRQFARGLDLIVVIEEKRPILEDQIRAILYGAENAPRLVGKYTEGGVFDPDHGAMALPNCGEISPDVVADVLANAILKLRPDSGLKPTNGPAPKAPGGAPTRMPGFCSGCPHSRSTRLPDGSRALAGIGCHTMAMFVNPMQTTTVSHMGAEGVMWLGQQPFTSEEHVFANIGDGTYAHSGFLAIRQAIAAHAPMTYKILYNGFVSMTGGQRVEAELSPSQMLHELAAEGVKKMAVVTDDPDKYLGIALPPGCQVFARTELEAVQKDFRTYKDVSVILYDQPCATERRRLRKRGKWEDPQKRVFINPEVCEGCGDCGKVSNCMSIEPLETELGRKRRINQASCNKDYSCVEGFCPSFVTVHGGALRKPDKAAQSQAPAWTLPLPDPILPPIDGLFSVLIGGIGGTGVVTIGQTLAMAAHLQGLYSSNLDVTGLSQKYGAVMSHVRLASAPEHLHATRIAAGETDTMIGCDLIVAAGDETLSKLRTGKSRAVVCTDLVPTAEFARNPNWAVDVGALSKRLSAIMSDDVLLLEGQRLARALLGDPIAANMFMLGAAWQRGQIPLELAAIERAIELNGVAIDMNKQAFVWGRRAAHDLATVETFARAGENIVAMPPAEKSLAELVADRAQRLVDYKDAAYAERYRALVDRVQRTSGDAALTRAVATYYYKLLAVKDEWEVARLYATPAFQSALKAEFEGDYTLHFHLGAWPFAKTDPTTGKPIKGEAGPWVMRAFRVMARLRGLRGSFLDPFRHSEDARAARAELARYEADIDALLQNADARGATIAARIAALPDKIRGYGHVRAQSAKEVAAEREKLFAQWRKTLAVAEKAA
jgi:indolepyruvate ferredoxin oxidoreductase